MLRLISTTRLLSSIPETLQNYQTVRWARKPIWMPTARSKLFRIPVRKAKPVEEEEEVRRLYNNYRTAIKSIRRFLTYRYSVLLQAKSDTEQLKKAFEEDLARCTAINNQWNEELKVQREQRIAKELQKDVDFAENRILQELQKKETQMFEAEEIVRKEKEAICTFITPENLDEAIEQAVNNPVDHNFAIDLQGNRIVGRDSQQSQPEEAAKVKQ